MNEDLMQENGLNMNALGGTEITYRKVFENLPRELFEKFQIFPSRVSVPLNPNKVRLLWCQDCAGDPMYDHLKNGGWNKFHKIVFVSNWQLQAFINYYGIPWSKCIVLQNFITPINDHVKPTDKINIAYWSTPQRGLQILLPVFQKLLETYHNIELFIHSSFKIYGQQDRDEQFKILFDICKNTEHIHYEAPLSNEELRNKLKNYHILAYPSIWPETACCVLQEAMSAKMLPVIPNYGALPETAANFANMYQWNEDLNHHATIFYSVLDVSIQAVKTEEIQKRLQFQKLYADIFYTWPKRALEWAALLTSLQKEPTAIVANEESKQFFEYQVR